MDSKPELTEGAGYEALKGHVLEKALLARKRYGPEIGVGAILRLLTDRDIVRFPTVMRFDAGPLLPGEFGVAEPLGEELGDGFALVLHPHFQDREEAIPLLAAYHVVAINYLDIATREEAELFGAALFGIEIDEYYARVCALADELPGMPSP